MKSRASPVYRRNVEYNRDYYCNNRNIDYRRDYHIKTSISKSRMRYEWTKDASCQCGRGNVICMPQHREEVKYYNGPKQVYTYSRMRSFTNVGVGNIMVQHKKRVRKIYLPETMNRAVGSSILFPVDTDRKYKNDSENIFYANKGTLANWVEEKNIRKCTEKLSPIDCYHSPHNLLEVKIMSKDIGNNTINKNFIHNTTQVEDNSVQKDEFVPKLSIKEINNMKGNEQELIKSVRSTQKEIQEVKVNFEKSSASLEQQVHNLEDPSYIPSTGSSDPDPMENKLEKEYRKMFSNKNKHKTIKEKPVNDLKSTSLLRRRFEALKRGIVKKDDSKKSSRESNPGHSKTGPIHIDISVESDPPSLEARSYSNNEALSSAPSEYKHARESKQHHPTHKKSYIDKRDKVKNDEHDVKGLFKMWEQNFNLDDVTKCPPTKVSADQKSLTPDKNINDNVNKTESQDKKSKRFFFFKKKSKDKTKAPSIKKGVTTGRCEVKNCIKLNQSPTKVSNDEPKLDPPLRPHFPNEDDSEDIIKKNWLQKFIQRTIESRKSLQIRWDNKTYTTSSSTVFELMDNVNRKRKVVIRSRSDTSTTTSSYYQSYHKHRVNFVQDIEAWMIPKLVTEREVPYTFFPENEASDRKWFIDKSKAFAHEIELVLKSYANSHRDSSEYVRIDIPKGFFTDHSSDSDRFVTSNSEEVYKIVEYDSPESRSELICKVKDSKIGDYSHNDKATKMVGVGEQNTETKAIETMIKEPPEHRDVVIQGSKVHIPTRREFINVGIITHRVNREIGRPLLKTDDEVSEESRHVQETSIKQCQFAESYLREYYRTWMPLGIDLFPSCASDVYVKCESYESLPSLHNQGDGTKSCPNICNDYQSFINLESCNSRCSYDGALDKNRVFNTFKSMTASEIPNEIKRILPKDSFEVLRKRMLYACGNKSKWNYPDDKPICVPSIEDKAEQGAIGMCKPDKSLKVGKKRVSITQCDVDPVPCPMNNPTSTIDVEPPPGILSFTGSTKTRKRVKEENNCEKVPPACKEYCLSSSGSKRSGERSSSSSSGPMCPNAKKYKNQCSSTLIKQWSKSKKKGQQSSVTIMKQCPNAKQQIKSRQGEADTGSNKSCQSEQSHQCKEASKSPTSITPPYPIVVTPPPLSSPPRTTCIDTICPCTEPPKKEKVSCLCLPKKKITKKTTSSSPVRCASSNSTQTTGINSPCGCIRCCLQKGHSQSSTGNIVSDAASQLANSSLSSDSKGLCSPMPDIVTPYPPDKCTPPLTPCQLPFNSSMPLPTSGTPRQGSACSVTKTRSLSKLLGLHLKKKPARSIPKCLDKCPGLPSEIKTQKKQDKKEICDDECLASISDEKVVIKVNASTEKTRENLNIKVQDADGNTLYERRDYKQDTSGGKIPSLLGEMYKINRMSTDILPLKDGNLSKDAKSIANIIEISFGLKVRQGDKLTEVNVGGDVEEDEKGLHCNNEKSQDVLLMQTSEVEPTVKDQSDMNDININIIIKNFKSKVDKSLKIEENNKSVDFCSTISKKFHTVSTGQSDVIPNQIDNMYSVHRTTIDSQSDLPYSVDDADNAMEKMVMEDIKQNTEANGESIPNETETDYEISTVEFSDNHQLKQEDSQYFLPYDKLIKSETVHSNTHNIKNTYEILNQNEDSTKTLNNNNCKKLDVKPQIDTLKSGQGSEKSATDVNVYITSTSVVINTSQTSEVLKITEMNVKSFDKNDAEDFIQRTDIEQDTSKNLDDIDIDSMVKTSNAMKHYKTYEANNNSEASEVMQNIQVGQGISTKTNDKHFDKKYAEDHLQRNDIIEHSIKERDTTEKIDNIDNNPMVKSNSVMKKNKTYDSYHNSEAAEIIQNMTGQAIQIPEAGESIDKFKVEETMQKSDKTEINESEDTETALDNNKTNNNVLVERVETTESRKSHKSIEKEVVIENQSKTVEIRTQNEDSGLQKSSINNNIKELEMGEGASKTKVEAYKIMHSETGEVILKINSDNEMAVSDIREPAKNPESCVEVCKLENLKTTTQKESELSKNGDNTKGLESSSKINEDKSISKMKDYESSLPTLQIKIQEPETDTTGNEGARSMELDSENEYTDSNLTKQTHKSETVSSMDTDDQDNEVELRTTTTTSDTTNDVLLSSKPRNKQEKKEMLKQVFEKASNKKWKSKNRMQRLKNMLKFILTSDSSEVDEVLVDKKVVKDLKYSNLNPSYYEHTDNLNNYEVKSALPSDGESKTVALCSTPNASEEIKHTDSSGCLPSTNECLCNAIAEKLNKGNKILTSGCRCRAPTSKINEKTSCDITDDDYYIFNYKSQRTDVHTQHSIINSKLTNMQFVNKMEAVTTSMKPGDFKRLKINHSSSPCQSIKECDEKTVNTSMQGLLDNGKVVIRSGDPNKVSLQTEIVIDIKRDNKEKEKELKNVFLACPANILQSYETKKAVLKIYTKKTMTVEGEKLVAKLPRYVYDKEHVIERSYKVLSQKPS